LTIAYFLKSMQSAVLNALIDLWTQNSHIAHVSKKSQLLSNQSSRKEYF
jgi:hypothetical protein